MIQIITASHKYEILRQNLLKSDIVLHFPLKIMRDYTNIPKAYNEANVFGKINVFVHHDVFLYTYFERELLKAIENAPADWVVMGLAGVRLENNQRKIVGYILDRGKAWGKPIKDFEPVDTLDELILITKGNIQFDEQFEQDFYGADICMQARQAGLGVYVFKGFCEHNSGRKVGERTSSFYESKKRFAEKWRDCLPVATTCALITE